MKDNGNLKHLCFANFSKAASTRHSDNYFRKRLTGI